MTKSVLTSQTFVALFFLFLLESLVIGETLESVMGSRSSKQTV